MDQVELDLELFALLDLGAVGIEQRIRFRDFARDGSFRVFLRHRAPAANGHLRADVAKLRHDLAMHRADIAAFDEDRLGHRHLAHNGLLNTETPAID